LKQLFSVVEVLVGGGKKGDFILQLRPFLAESLGAFLVLPNFWIF
jgi:hypothetical protein